MIMEVHILGATNLKLQCAVMCRTSQSVALSHSIEQVGLGGEASEYCLIQIDHGGTPTPYHFIFQQSIHKRPPSVLYLHTDESRLNPDATPTPGCSLWMEDACVPRLAVIPIKYEDLEGVEHEPTTLFADTTTTAGYVHQF